MKAHPTIIGVIGTNGKTSTATWLAHALHLRGGSVGLITTFGAFLDDRQVPVSRTFAGFEQFRALCESHHAGHLVIEITSEAIARRFLDFCRLDAAMFTSFSRDHLEVHRTMRSYLECKAEAFARLPPGGAAIVNADDPASQFIIDKTPRSVTIVRYALMTKHQAGVDLTGYDVEPTWTGTRGRVRLPDLRERELRIHAIGDIFVSNALAVLGAAQWLGLSPDLTLEALATAPVPPGRFQIVSTRPRVVVDFAHNPDALARTLQTARRLCPGKLTVVFGAGGGTDLGKRALMGIASERADEVILTSDNPRKEDPLAICRMILTGIPVERRPRVEIILDRGLAIQRAVAAAGALDVVVIAGKGPEETQIFRDRIVDFSDVNVARSAIAEISSQPPVDPPVHREPTVDERL